MKLALIDAIRALNGFTAIEDTAALPLDVLMRVALITSALREKVDAYNAAKNKRITELLKSKPTFARATNDAEEAALAAFRVVEQDFAVEDGTTLAGVVSIRVPKPKFKPEELGKISANAMADILPFVDSSSIDYDED